jgi:hypothetical protein
MCLLPHIMMCQMMFMSFNSDTTGVSSGAETANPFGTPEFNPGF